MKTCYKVVLTNLIQSWYNKNVIRLTTQGCDNVVISWLCKTCWNNLVTSLIIPTRLLQVVNSLFQTCWQLVTSSAKTACWQICYKMWDFCVSTHEKSHSHLVTSLLTSRQQVVFALLVTSCQQVWKKLLILSDLLQGCLNSRDIAELLQPCVINLVTFLLYHDCIRHVRTTLKQVW